MADPLVAPALVGFAVTTLLTEVITSAKMAYYCKDECDMLAARLENIEPLVRQADQNSSKGNAACTKWLTDFQGLLEHAKGVTNECILESRHDKARRALKFWRWKKLPSRVMKVNGQIEEVRANANLVTLGIVLSMNPGKVTKPSGFVEQGTPSLIVGVDEHFKKLKACIVGSHGKDKPSYFGLQGRGGAGKTLLAQMLNDDEDIRKTYGEDFIIWITVGLDARVCDVYKRMGNSGILDDGLCERLKSMKNQEEQRKYLRNGFGEKKILLILDDVWEKQCDHREMMYWLDIATGAGCATLITSRSSSVLSKVRAEVEVVLSLPEEESWKLFCFYAFDSESCLARIPEKLGRGVCKECKGLPLALKVIGSAMVGKETIEEWRCALYDLKQSKPILDSNVDDELFGRLQLSYNELKDDATKICFLYFAAFPEDYEIWTEDLFNIWIGEGLFGTEVDVKYARDKARAHLEVLVKRSLIEWSKGVGKVQVHDILRDLAVYIIERVKPGECGYGCFFQSGKVSTSFPRSESLNEIRRMSFIDCSISEWPENLQAPRLEVCILRGVTDIDDRIPEFFFSGMRFLKYLDISRNILGVEGKLPSLRGLMCLEHLDIGWCGSVKELPEIIRELKCLRHLKLTGCRSLKELPESICKLKCLKILDVSFCKSLKELPESMGELTCLRDLDLTECRSLKELPESMSELKCLRHLDLRGCKSLKEVPKCIAENEVLNVIR